MSEGMENGEQAERAGVPDESPQGRDIDVRRWLGLRQPAPVRARPIIAYEAISLQL